MTPLVAVPPRRVLIRTMAANAFLLSALYLVVGLVLELLRRRVGWPVATRLLIAMDALPARALDAVGLLTPLREAYLAGDVREWVLRAVFSLTAMVVIFATAVFVGLVMSGLGLALRRRRGI